MLYVEIADNPHLHEKGLMFRKELESNAGMLFKFNKPSVLKFWGLNTFIPLDIAFVSTDNEILKISKIEPHCRDGVSSEKDCLMAIEANNGFFIKEGIREGDKIAICKDDLGFDVITFLKKNKKENRNKG